MAIRQLIASTIFPAAKWAGFRLLVTVEFVFVWMYRLRWYEALAGTGAIFIAAIYAALRNPSATYTEYNITPQVASMYFGILFLALIFAYAHYSRGWLRFEDAREM